MQINMILAAMLYAGCTRCAGSGPNFLAGVAESELQLQWRLAVGH